MLHIALIVMVMFLFLSNSLPPSFLAWPCPCHS